MESELHRVSIHADVQITVEVKVRFVTKACHLMVIVKGVK